MLEVSELYTALQGEGPYLGRPSLFVRLRRCNLTCSWCDSKQTWDVKHPDFQVYRTMPPAFLARDMYQVATVDGRRPTPAGLVITGGEPLIWQRFLPEVIDRYRDLARPSPAEVEVETNGVITPSDEMLDRCHFNVSHKMPSSGNDGVPDTRLWNTEATERYLERDAIFKVVVGDGDELSTKLYVSWLVKVAQQLSNKTDKAYVQRRVFLMPEGVTREEVVAHQAGVLELAEELGVAATTRMHIIAYDNERRR